MKATRNRERRDWRTMRPSDWMEMTPSDWMNMAPSEWMNLAMSGLNRTYADWINTMPSDWAKMMYAPGTRPGDWSSVWEKQTYRRRTHGRCERCDSESCECYCCVGDADLTVYSYFGEQRVIPIVVENERHRETEISLELSSWNTPGGRPAPVETVLLEPKTFTLASCGEQKVILAVRIFDVATGEDQPREDLRAAAAADQEAQRQLRDVDDCLVATADLRLVGCDHRPLRIAVAILPRDCDPYRVTCGCTC